jgi:hypothetical protein
LTWVSIPRFHLASQGIALGWIVAAPTGRRLHGGPVSGASQALVPSEIDQDPQAVLDSPHRWR